MEVHLTERQREYVEKYQSILNRLSDIQTELGRLGKESEHLITELKDLRSKERLEFPDSDSIIENLQADSE